MKIELCGFFLYLLGAGKKSNERGKKSNSGFRVYLAKVKRMRGEKNPIQGQYKRHIEELNTLVFGNEKLRNCA